MTFKVEVIAIGNEILTGFTVNSNAATIGQALLGIGIRVTGQRTLGDNRESLQTGLRDALSNNNLVICSGGLGPTCDDMTRQYIAEVFNCDLKYEESVATHLKQNFAKKIKTVENQSMIPSKAKYILNQIGTACALIFLQNGCMAIFLPGVPSELQHFLHKDIIPLLIESFPNARCEFRQQCYFMQLGESQVDPILRHLLTKYPDVEFGIYPNLGLISVHIISKFATQEENLSYQSPIKDELIAAFRDNLYSETDKHIENVIIDICLQNKITIGLGETSPYIHLSSLLGPVLSTSNGTLHVALHGIPNLIATEEIYFSDVSVVISKNNKTITEATANLRGNKRMFIARTEHFALCEIFKLLRKEYL